MGLCYVDGFYLNYLPLGLKVLHAPRNASLHRKDWRIHGDG